MKLYKYYSFDKGNYSINGLQNSQVYFSDPLGFNDPFDSKPELVNVEFKDQADVIVARDRVFASADSGLLRELYAMPITKLEALMKGKYEEIMRRELENCGVTCYSESGINNAMWYYYADKHKGFVLEFDKSNPYFDKCYKVNYSDVYPVITGAKIGNVDPNAPKLVSSIFLNKSEEWKHEKEWRCIHNEKAIAFEFEPEMLTGVVLGKDCEEENENKIKEILEQSKFEHVTLEKLEMVPNSYKLNPMKIK